MNCDPIFILRLSFYRYPFDNWCLPCNPTVQLQASILVQRANFKVPKETSQLVAAWEVGLK